MFAYGTEFDACKEWFRASSVKLPDSYVREKKTVTYQTARVISHILSLPDAELVKHLRECIQSRFDAGIMHMTITMTQEHMVLNVMQGVASGGFGHLV